MPKDPEQLAKEERDAAYRKIEATALEDKQKYGWTAGYMVEVIRQRWAKYKGVEYVPRPERPAPLIEPSEPNEEDQADDRAGKRAKRTTAGIGRAKFADRS